MKKVEFTEEVIKAAYEDIRTDLYYGKAMEDYSDLDGAGVLYYLMCNVGEEFQGYSREDLITATMIFVEKDVYTRAVEQVYNLLIADITADFRDQFFGALE